MSVLAYFEPLRETRMPRAASQPDPLHINWQGPVLEDHLTVRQTFEKSELQARTPPRPPAPVRRYEPRPIFPAV